MSEVLQVVEDRTKQDEILASISTEDTHWSWFDKAIDVFKRNRNPGGEAYARHELGRLLAHEEQPAAARKEFDRAARLCRSNGLAGQLRSIEATLKRPPLLVSHFV